MSEQPRGPHVPTVLRGLFVLVVAALVFVWRLVDDPDWTIVGIVLGIATGVVLLLVAVAGVVIQRMRKERDFDRMLSGS